MSLKVGSALSILYVLFSVGALIYVAILTKTATGDLTTGSIASEEQLGAIVAAIFILPHVLTGLIALVFNILGLKKNKKGFILIACIFYTITVFLFPIWTWLLIPGVIVLWVGFAKFKKV